jgi:predicted RNA-binding Zn-ribbon protein involved in translation (DUF1610 family)
MDETTKIDEMKRANIEYCPHCGTNLQGEPIPEEYRDLHYGGTTHYSRKIAWTDLALDRIVKWSCPDCLGEWERKLENEK